MDGSPPSSSTVLLHRSYVACVALIKLAHCILLTLTYFVVVRGHPSLSDSISITHFQICTSATCLTFLLAVLPLYIWSVYSVDPITNAKSWLRLGGLIDFAIASFPAFLVETSIVWTLGFVHPLQTASFLVCALTSLIALCHSSVFVVRKAIDFVAYLRRPPSEPHCPADDTIPSCMLQIHPPPYPKAPSGIPLSPTGMAAVPTPISLLPPTSVGALPVPLRVAGGHSRGFLPPGPPSTTSSSDASWKSSRASSGRNGVPPPYPPPLSPTVSGTDPRRGRRHYPQTPQGFTSV